MSLLPHMVEMDRETWLRYGWEKGFCTPPICFTHDGMPMTADEDEEWINGEDPCIYTVRLYADHEERLAVEYNSGFTSWRASNRGWTRDDG